MTPAEIRALPKYDLHCHLDGSLTLASVSGILGRRVMPEELQVSRDCRDLAEYLEKFGLPLKCLQTEENLKRAAYDFLMDVSRENVRYIEVRFAPQFSANESMNCGDVIEAVLDGLTRAQKECGTDFQIIVCAMRHMTEEENLTMLSYAEDFIGKGVCAADLAGNEAAYPMKDFTDLFRKVRAMGMPFTIHAGECGSVQNVIDAVGCGASRIGHGIAMRGNRDAIKLCRENDICIEMCPSSNIQTRAVQSLSEYPLREFLDAGLNVTINTDNRTVSGTTVSKEIQFVQDNFSVTDDEIIKMMGNAGKSAFYK